ncbi:MAG: 50S ribosome-binding GTPase [Gordonia sp. (in: high G+C Gram-positive bacteria)]
MADAKRPPGKVPATPEVVLRQAVDVLRTFDENELADRAERVAAQPPPEGSVVVIGEISRGKSSLVNSLISSPGLAPVDTEMATSIHVRFTPATPALPVGAADIEFPGLRHRIDAADLAEWVTVGGRHAGRMVRPGGDDADLADVGVPAVAARVGISSELLPGTVIVDTPGVGSLIPEHVRAAVSAARGAGVLVMVCDATAPMSAPELDFLSQVGAEISAVVIVVTKIDLVMRQWRTIVAENRALIAKHAPRFAHAPIIGVSNRIAEQARAISDPERAAQAFAASGMAELVATLTPLVADTSASPQRNALQVAFTGLDAVRSRLLLEMAALRSAPQVRAELEAERERLTRLKEHKREWAIRLQQDMAALATRSDDLLREEFDGLAEQWHQRIDKLRFHQASRSQELVGQMTVDLEAVARTVSAAYVEGIDEIAAALFVDAEIRSTVLDRIAASTADLELRGEKKVSPWKNLVDPTLFTLMLSGGPLALIPGANIVALPIWAGVVLGFRATRAGKENHRKWLTKAVTDMKADVRSQLRGLNAQASGDLRLAYDALLEKSLAESNTIITEAAADAKRSAEERRQALADIKAKVTTVDTVRKNLQVVLKRSAGAGQPGAGRSRAGQQARPTPE